MDSSVVLVRASLNDNPEYVKNVLIWDMARPAGDDPRVSETCAYFIDNSTNTQNVVVALQALGVVSGKLPSDKKPQIADIIRRAFRHDNLRIQAVAAAQLGALGHEYRSEANKLDREIFKRYHKAVPDEQLIQELGYIEGDSDSLKLISDVIDKSTSSAAAAQAIQALGIPNSDDPAEMRRRVEIMRHALTKANLKFIVRSRTADLIVQAGGAYREEGYKAYLQLLNDPGDLSDSTNSWAYNALFRKVLMMDRPDFTPSLRSAVAKNKDAILKFYEQGMAHLDKNSSDYRNATKQVEKIEALANGPAK